MESNEENKAAIVSETTPAMLLQLAVSKDLDIEKLGKLMDLQERWNANKARVAFLDAMALFQNNVPALKKTKQVSYSTTNYKFAPLGEIAATIKGTMFECGLSHRWEIKDAETAIECTCIISHKEGHSERTTMSGNKDASGGKNEIQQRGSTITYLQRYTLIAALGISTADEDNDGQEGNKGNAPEQKQEQKPSKELPWLDVWTDKSKKEFTKPGAHTISKLNTGEITIETVEQHYKLNKETKEFLLTQVKPAASV